MRLAGSHFDRRFAICEVTLVCPWGPPNAGRFLRENPFDSGFGRLTGRSCRLVRHRRPATLPSWPGWTPSTSIDSTDISAFTARR